MSAEAIALTGACTLRWLVPFALFATTAWQFARRVAICRGQIISFESHQAAGTLPRVRQQFAIALADIASAQRRAQLDRLASACGREDAGQCTARQCAVNGIVFFEQRGNEEMRGV